MSQRTIVIVIAVIAVALFAGASFFYLNRSTLADISEPAGTGNFTRK